MKLSHHLSRNEKEAGTVKQRKTVKNPAVKRIRNMYKCNQCSESFYRMIRYWNHLRYCKSFHADNRSSQSRNEDNALIINVDFTGKTSSQCMFLFQCLLKIWLVKTILLFMRLRPIIIFLKLDLYSFHGWTFYHTKSLLILKTTYPKN